MKKLFLSLIFVIFLGNICFANNKVSNINMKVTIKDDGSANITQKWMGTFSEGTENYIPLENLDYDLTNFKVKQIILGGNDSEDIEYEFISLGSNWNIDASSAQKKNKCGIHRTGSKSLELCWGIGDYGYNIYELSYDINPLVKGYTDVDGFNFQFINDGMNTGPTTGEVIIEFENQNLNITEENTRAWGFGYEGEVEFWNNGIHFYTRQDLTANDSMICMVNFDKGIINPLIQINKSFDEGVKNEALKGSEFEKTLKEKNYTWERIKVVLCTILFFANLILIWFLAIKGGNYLLGLFMSLWSSGFVSGGIATGFPLFSIVGIGVVLMVMLPPALKQLKWEKLFNKINYSRNIPKNEELFMVYKCITPNKKQLKIKEDNLIASMMMIMIKNGNIEPVKEIRTKLLGGVSDEVNLKLLERPIDGIYAKLYDLLKIAAGSDGILQKNEIKRIGLEYTSKVESLLSIAESQGLDDCKDNELGNPDKINKLTEKGIDYLSNIIGLKKYFNDFTLLNERDIQEVANWEGMLIFATLLGEAAKVMSRLKILYPEAPEIQNYVNTIHICNDFNSSLNAGISIHHKQEQAKAAMKAARGGGGHSSHSGGGGHSGGGHGGGSR